MVESFNTRVLVIDDETVVRESFCEILAPRRSIHREALDKSAAALFGEPARLSKRGSVGTIEFACHEAASGQRGLDLVQAAKLEGTPYALVFLDMRMPGWDGLETAQRIRQIDEKVEIVFVTAYSDHTVEEIVAKAGANVGYHCKPFAPDEIRQIATKAVYDWNKLRGLESLIAIAGDLRASEAQMDTVLRSVLSQVCERLGSKSAAILSRSAEANVVSARLCSGLFQDAKFLQPAIDELSKGLVLDPITKVDRLVLIAVDELTVVTLLEDGLPLDTERLYLLRLFIEHASRAIESSRLHAELVKRERLSSLGEAMSKVVHDLRQPLTVIQGAILLVGLPKLNPEKLPQLHRMIASGAEDLMDYVDDILAFTRAEPPVLEATDFTELFGHLEQKAQLLFADRAAWLRFSVPPGLCGRVAPRKIQRVILNLASNAIEALTQTDIANPEVCVSLHTEGAHGVFRVSDNGRGVPVEVRQTLFDPFVTHGKTGGTGLGLAICRQIAESHGGTLRLLPSDRGATFEMRIPFAESPGVVPTAKS